MLDAHQLNIFLIAAETLNFTQTANHLHMTQPSVSQHIQSLENYFDTLLFHRRGRHLELSDAGAALVPLARDLISASIHIEETMKSLEGEVYGHLLVGCSTTPGKYVLPQLLTEFHHQYPHVRVTCQVTSQDDAINKLRNGEIHFALTSTDQDNFKEAEFYQFLRDPIVLIAPLDHPWTKKTEIEPEDLLEADFILREGTSGTLIAVNEALSKAEINVTELHTLLTLGNSEAIALTVQEGLGVGFVSSMVVEKICHGKVATIKINNLEICRDIGIGRQTRFPASGAQIAFWDFIKQ